MIVIRTPLLRDALRRFPDERLLRLPQPLRRPLGQARPQARRRFGPRMVPGGLGAGQAGRGRLRVGRSPRSAPASTASPRSSRPHGTNPCPRPRATGSSSRTWRSTSTSKARSSTSRTPSRCSPTTTRSNWPTTSSTTITSSEHPGKAAYLLHEDWRLPTTSGDGPYDPACRSEVGRPPVPGDGDDLPGLPRLLRLGGLTDLDEFGGPCRIDGVRIPELADYLEATPPGRGLAVRVEAAPLPDRRRTTRRGSARGGAGAGRPPPGPSHRRDDSMLDSGSGDASSRPYRVRGGREVPPR